jgi:hypothetical protein
MEPTGRADARPMREIRDRQVRIVPDCALLHPGYKDWAILSENLRFRRFSAMFCRPAAVAFVGRIWHSSVRCRRFVVANLSDAGVAQW